MRTKAILFVAALLLVPARSAYAWGCRGHQIVALVALTHLEPAVAQQVDMILNASPIPTSQRRGCGAEAGLPLVASVSTWADDERSVEPSTGPYHYVDIPLEATRNTTDLDKLCHEDCVTWAIAHYTDQLKTSTDAQQRAEALRYVIHFVGDLHQPLHAVTNSDQGGNCVPVQMLDQAPQIRNLTTGSASPNLHSVWDTAILGTIHPNDTPQQFAEFLGTQHGPLFAEGSKDVADWAWESHQVAVDTVYGKLNMKVPVDREPEPTNCADRNHLSERLLALHEVIDPGYIDNATPAIEQQLEKAGLRLADLLNRTLAPNAASH